ncbi:MAG: ATP-binding protein, partial [Chloroflexota bacterium]|nr:ATP-binding protein [Chloroflexota bacterium]
TLDDPAVPVEEHFSSEQLARYRLLADLHAVSDSSALLLESAFSISAAALLEPLEESFESSAGEILRIQTAMGESDLQAAVDPLLDRLVDLGLGDDSVFVSLSEVLILAETQDLLAAENRGISVSLVSQVDSLVDAANERAAEATLASDEATLTGQALLLSISGISVGGAILIAWLFVGRSLLRRLATLSAWMRRMASGDLEAQIEMKGHDEVANMAAALEVFRQHALEVQRLNLVEELANELQGKNEQLEGALSELNRAQDQIVMREKLAALGELTAGVAHEIRNPLNFVKNFSEVSSELLEELHEVLEEAGDSIPQNKRDDIQDISDDLSSNLERIGQHTARANRIVHDMLMMGRDTAEWQTVDVNNLVDEYARLAYHSARATDPDFQLDLQFTLADNVGQLEAIPQDLGRVFLNVVSNACYATDEKRKEILQSGGGDYMPTIWLTTVRDDENITITIRDNANGMPQDVVEKIFNPFFTTKPTGQGTGLGLAISNDIIREHGGGINVESTPGEGTEMTIRLPLVNLARSAESSDQEAVADDDDDLDPDEEVVDTAEPVDAEDTGDVRPEDDGGDEEQDAEERT